MEARLRSAVFVGVILVAGLLVARELHRAQERLEWRTRGVLTHNPSMSYPGWNLFCSQSKPEAYLLDMEGREIHRWVNGNPDSRKWHHVELMSDGALLAIESKTRLEKLSWDSESLWSVAGRFHHDLDQGEDGTLFALERGEDRLTFDGEEIRFLNDYISILSPSGERRVKHSVFALVKALVPRGRLRELSRYMKSRGDIPLRNDTPAELFHTNSIEVVSQDIPGVALRGDLLLSLRNLNTIAIVRLDGTGLVWAWGSRQLDHPHQPTVLVDGNILIFDNGRERRYTQVIELNPISRRIEWIYPTTPRLEFYSHRRGGAQRLPNGNTLMTLAEKGTVYEVTRTGEVVWKFMNYLLSDRRASQEQVGEGLYRMTRYRPHQLAITPN